MKEQNLQLGGQIFKGDPYQEDWPQQAACQGEGDRLFVRGALQNKVAKGCGACLVQAACLRDAIELKEEWGIRGGLTERTRRALVRNMGGHDRVLAVIDRERNKAIARQIAQNNNPQEHTHLSVPLHLADGNSFGFDAETQIAS